jgi:hypothetical protein
VGAVGSSRVEVSVAIATRRPGRSTPRGQGARVALTGDVPRIAAQVVEWVRSHSRGVTAIA